MSKLEVDAIEPQSGTTLTIGASGDTITIPSGATLTNSGTATGFGKILQVVTNSDTTTVTNTTTSMAEIINASITPSSASNKILVFAQLNINIQNAGNAYCESTVFRGTTAGTQINDLQSGNGSNTQFSTVATHCFIDTPSTTSSQQYTLAFRRASGATSSVATQSGNTYNITLMEIEA